MKKIILTRGLPASGKSTWSTEFVAKSNGKAKRVNKDLLREMVDGGVWSKTNEQLILKLRDRIVIEYIRAGIDTIIVDDTNFEDKHYTTINDVLNSVHDCMWHEMNSMHDHYNIEYKDFFEPSVDECILRDAKRPKPVGEKVIRGMWNRYKDIIKPDNREGGNIRNKLGDTILCDLDGTLCLKGDRGWYDLDKVGLDDVNTPIANIVRAFHEKGYTILYVSGREGNDVCSRESLRWLQAHDLWFDRSMLLMRMENDTRNDAIVKEEIYKEEIEGKYDVEFVLDDRQRVVDMWRRNGLRCLQVAPGNF
jgi:predicted kinase